MSHLEALIAATLRFLGVSYTETGVHFMTQFIALFMILVALMVVLVTFLEVRSRMPHSFEKSVMADIRSL